MSALSEKDYELLVAQARALVEGEEDWIANSANLSALLFHELKNVNFAGIYRFENNELILGPFQGKPACIHITKGHGVCGKVANTKEVEIVPDVHQFKGHIACDSETNSEIVIPIFKEGKFWGEFDFDSTKFANFDVVDEKYLTQIANLLFN